MTETVKKPPLGVMPRFLWDERRMVDLTEAIERFTDAGEPVPEEWYYELIEVTTSVCKHMAKRDGKSIAEVIADARQVSDILDQMGEHDG